MSKIDKSVFWYFETYSGSLDFEIAKEEFEALPESEKEKIKNEATTYYNIMGFDCSAEKSAQKKRRQVILDYLPQYPKTKSYDEAEKEFDNLAPEEQKKRILDNAKITRELLLKYAKGKAARKDE